MFFFEYEGIRYTVDMSSFNYGRIKLPTGVLLEVTMWLESNPPQIGGLQVIEEIPGIAYSTAVLDLAI
jgi:hypothetical protein